jgi:two-component system, LuxR family, sensor kinase FixL
MITFRRIWKFLTIPLSEEHDTALREQMTRVIFVIVSIGLLLMSIIVPVFDFSIGDPSYIPTLIMLAVDGLVVVGWYLIFRGHWTISRYLIPFIFIALGIYFVYMAGPITTGVLQFAIAILLTASMFGNKAQWIAVLICEVLYLAFGWLSGERDFETIFTSGIVVGVSLGGIATLQWYVARLLTTSLTRARQAELASRTAAGKIRAIFESINDGITITDLQGIITDFNEATLRLHNYEHRDDLAGLNAFDLITKDSHPKAMENLRLTLENGAGGRLEYKLVRSDGSVFDGELNAVVIKDEANQPIGFAALTRDITLRKKAESEREALIQKLEEKNKELESFTYTVSHDLKAPLVTIAGFLGYLAQDINNSDVDKVQKDIHHINQAVAKMQRLLMELLELSRIGRMVNQPEKVSFYDIVQEALKHIEGRLAEKKFDIQVEENLPVVVGDRTRLVEVMQNLIDNAAKFMGDQPNPLIEIGQRVNDSENDKPIFYVRDNGIGIDSAHHERIFGLFNKLNPQAEGTGIGLAIVKKIVEVHDGRIWVESEAGKGATFFFTLSQDND